MHSWGSLPLASAVAFYYNIETIKGMAKSFLLLQLTVCKKDRNTLIEQWVSFFINHTEQFYDNFVA